MGDRILRAPALVALVAVVADGSFAIDGVPPSTWTVFAYARRAAKPASALVTVVAGQDATVNLTLVRGAEPPHVDKFSEKYKVPTTTYRKSSALSAR